MSRVKGGSVSKTRRRKVLKEAKGYFGSKHRLYKTAQEQVFHSGNYAFRDRKQNKRNFRKLWITRINAACRMNDISYSKFISGLAKANIEVNRKMLAELAISDEAAFTNLVNIAKEALAGKEYKPAAVKPEKKVEVKAEEAPKKAAAKKTTTKKQLPLRMQKLNQLRKQLQKRLLQQKRQLKKKLNLEKVSIDGTFSFLYKFFML